MIHFELWSCRVMAPSGPCPSEVEDLLAQHPLVGSPWVVVDLVPSLGHDRVPYPVQDLVLAQVPWVDLH